MQSMRIAPFENIWAQSIDLLNKQLAATIDLQLWLIEMLRVTGRRGAAQSRTPHPIRNESSAAIPFSVRRVDLSDRPADTPAAVRDMNDRIGIWVNEGGAGGEVNR